MTGFESLLSKKWSLNFENKLSRISMTGFKLLLDMVYFLLLPGLGISYLNFYASSVII